MARKVMVGGLWERSDVAKLKTLAIRTGRSQVETLKILVRTATVAPEPDIRAAPLTRVEAADEGEDHV